MSPWRGHLLLLRRCYFTTFRRLYSSSSSSSPSSPPAESSAEPTPPPKTPIQLLRNSPYKLHIYRSKSTNPFFNLSAEDYLLRHSPVDSTLLFTYTNSPSVVIGRNQNPWSELNFPLLRSPPYSHVNFVRRRSGGGTVYHDLGNLCWSVIMPRKAFDRDTNAHMIVRALERLGVSNAAVNARHDIVLKAEDGSEKKVSGSAYKIIKDRAYHHATLLLNSELSDIGRLLHSPLRDFMTSKGVESVRSPVANIGVDTEQLVRAIEVCFLKQYSRDGGKDEVSVVDLEEEETIKGRDYIREGMEELQSTKWLYTQTPNFFLQIPSKTQLPELPGLPGLSPVIPEHGKVKLLATNAKILSTTITTSPDPSVAFLQSQESHIRLLNKDFSGPSLNSTIREIKSLSDSPSAHELASWLNVAVGEWIGDKDWDEKIGKDGEKTLRARAAERKLERYKHGKAKIEEKKNSKGAKKAKVRDSVLDKQGVYKVTQATNEFEVEGSSAVIEKKSTPSS
ncbi:Biotin/lipoate A/B protein ligase [Orbilia ellipsospora]|uniref:Putative lipoate-protein ligase A n=1 Tax=Orbilia ellipsospora TaxID=2528407 RepID=A0AAV9WUE1_9PEZI